MLLVLDLNGRVVLESGEWEERGKDGAGSRNRSIEFGKALEPVVADLGTVTDPRTGAKVKLTGAVATALSADPDTGKKSGWMRAQVNVTTSEQLYGFDALGPLVAGRVDELAFSGATGAYMVVLGTVELRDPHVLLWRQGGV